MTNVLICGGRHFFDRQTVYYNLNRIHHSKPFGLVVTGGAQGADFLGDEWAMTMGIPRVVFPANWEGEGRTAGSTRNQRMIDLINITLVVAFPGGTGTADMCKRARNAEIEVIKI